MVATYPRTKYSPIGDIHGVRTGDDLFLHFFRHVAIRRPELYVVENVPGMKKFPVVSVRPYTVREYARLQGVPDSFTFCGRNNDAYRMIGNGVSVPVGEWIGSAINRYFNHSL